MVKLASVLPDSPSAAAKLLLGMLTGAKSCAKQTNSITEFSQQPQEDGSIKIPVPHMRSKRFKERKLKAAKLKEMELRLSP